MLVLVLECVQAGGNGAKSLSHNVRHGHGDCLVRECVVVVVDGDGDGIDGARQICLSLR